ncbi:hypothetical protein DFJ73DRAFT_962396 [Zopfochytrium polystomum]|nr:hypothetical protein DFJ73DRAFT_962396 [Zopfochytrium polystomum]
MSSHSSSSTVATAATAAVTTTISAFDLNDDAADYLSSRLTIGLIVAAAFLSFLVVIGTVLFTVRQDNESRKPHPVSPHYSHYQDIPAGPQQQRQGQGQQAEKRASGFHVVRDANADDVVAPYVPPKATPLVQPGSVAPTASGTTPVITTSASTSSTTTTSTSTTNTTVFAAPAMSSQYHAGGSGSTTAAAAAAASADQPSVFLSTTPASSMGPVPPKRWSVNPGSGSGQLFPEESA